MYPVSHIRLHSNLKCKNKNTKFWYRFAIDFKSLNFEFCVVIFNFELFFCAEYQGDVARPLSDARRAPERSRAKPLQHGASINDNVLHDQIAFIKPKIILCVRDR